MQLTLERFEQNSVCTLGYLYVGKEFECYVLELPKPIPAGDYDIDVTYSPRFKANMPILLNVRGYTGIRIHKGNTVQDTEGCLLVGKELANNVLKKSKVAFDQLMAKMDRADDIRIRIYETFDSRQNKAPNVI